MKRGITQYGIGAAVLLAILVAGGAVFVYSGLYNIGADDHHTRPVFALMQTLRERSVAVRSRTSPENTTAAAGAPPVRLCHAQLTTGSPRPATLAPRERGARGRVGREPGGARHEREHEQSLHRR